MAITTFTNYHSSGYQDVSLELTDYNESSITALKYTDNYNNYNWLTFNSVVIEALSQQDINNGYTGYVKIVALGRSDTGGNQIFFLQQASGSGQQSVNLDTLLLSPDWGSLWWQSGIISGTYTPPAPSPTVFIDQEMAAVSDGDVLTATVDLDGGTLEYFAWEQYDAVASSWVVIAGGEGSPVIGLTVDETMSEKQIQAMIRVSGIWTSSSGTMPVLQAFVGHWSFDNGDAVADIGDDGVNNGALFQSLNGRTIATFDGVNDYIQIPDPSVLSGDTWTISHWINTSATSGRQDYFAKWYSSNGNYPSIALGIDGGALKAYYRGDNKNSIGIMTGPSIADGSWHHVAYVKDSGEVRIYVDGSEADQAAFSGTIPSTADIVLGAWDGSILGYAKDHYFDGSLDDLRIYSTALDSSQVSDLYTETTVLDNTSPVITIIGDNPMSVAAGDVFADPGATALDDFDGSVAVTASGGDSINVSDDWEQCQSYTMPTVNGDGSVSFPNVTNAITKKENGVAPGDVEIVVEFDNNSIGNGDFGINMNDGTNMIVFRQQQYNAWGASNSFFFGFYNGSTYVASGAGPAQLTSGAMKIVREGWVYKFYSSSDKVNFTEMGQFDTSALGWTPAVDLELRVGAGSRTADMTGFSRSDLSEGAQEGSYTITYSATDGSGNDSAAQRSVVVASASVDPSISIALPASQVYGESFIQTLDLQGATEYNVNWEFNGPEGWTSISDVNADKLVPWQYDYYEVRALLVIAEVPYYSNVVDPSEFFPRYSWVSDVTSASLGDTLTLSIDLKGYVATAANPIGYVRNTSFASTNYDDSRYHGDFTYVSQVGEILTYTVELTADLHQRYLSPTINMAPNANVASFYALGESGAYHGPSVMVPDLSGDLVPVQKNGYQPLFLTEAEANLWPAGDATSHSHSFDSVIYYMPNGLTMNINQFHGLYGQAAQYDLDSDAVASVGSVNGTATNVTFQSGEGRDYAYFDGSGSKIDLGQSSNMGIGGTDDFTVSAWIRPDTLNMTSGQIFGTVVTGATSPQYAGFQLYIANGVLKFMIGGNGYDTISYTLPAGLESIWSHFAVSRSGTEVKMYMNGALVHTGTTSAVHNITTSHAGHLYAIGSYYSPYNNTWYTGFEGGIDDLRVHNRAMDPAEVAYWHTATTVADPNGPQTLSVEQFDSYGDSWNGGSLDITDANGNSVFSTTGPANGVKAPAGLTESMTLDNNAAYSYTVTPGQYPSEVTWNIKDASGIVLVSWSNGDSVTGTFTLGTPPLYPGITGTFGFRRAAGTIEFTNIQTNADGISAGGTQWAYSLSPLGDVGQAHGGTAVDFGNFTLSGLPEQQSLTLYYGLIDASGLVLMSTSLSGDTREKTRHELTMWDAYGDGWDGTYFEVYDSNGATVYSTTRPVAQFDHDGDGQITEDDGKYSHAEYIDLADGDYTWALVGGSYPEEHSFTFVRQDNNLSLASSTASNPISGSFTVAADVIPPVITIAGENPMSLVAGDTFVDPGASAVDAQDGVLSVSVTGHENMSVSDDWVAYSGYNLSAPTIDGDLVTSGGVYGHNYSVKKENNIAAGADFELVVEFEDVTLPWAQYDPEFRLRVDFIGNALSAEIKMQAYYAWSASNTFFSGFRTQHNSGQTYSGQTSGGSLVQDGAFKVVRVGSTVTMYRREGSEGEFVQMSSQTSANYAGEARIDMMFQNTPGKIVSLTRSDMQTGAILGDYTISYSATDSAGNTASVNRAVNVGSGAYDPMHGGKLQNIVSFIPGKDSQGVPVYAYSTVGEGNTTKLYFTQDFQTWASFTSYDVSVTGIDSAPTCLEFGQNGKFFLGTVSGKLYEISVGENGIPTAYALLETVSGSPKIDSVIYGDHSNQWIFSYEGKINTVEIGGGAVVQRLSLPAGAKCVDIAEGPNGVAMILKKENNSLEPMLAFNNWTSIVGPAGMTIDVASLNPTEFNHSEHLGKWATADAAGTNVLTTSDLLSWIT